MLIYVDFVSPACEPMNKNVGNLEDALLYDKAASVFREIFGEINGLSVIVTIEDPD